MAISTPQFDHAYSRLNPAQKQAVDTLEGPVMVLAGPGTGKTQVLTVRIANILHETDTDPSSILALTYTDAAAREMKERLIALIGKPGYFVKIGTYHALCNDLITHNPERFSRSGLQTVTELEQIQILKDILEKNSFSLLKPVGDPLFYISYILSSISDLKREGYPADQYAELVSQLQSEFESQKDDLGKTARADMEKLVLKNLDLLHVYRLYQQQLTSLGRYDYDDMINWVVAEFEKDEDFLLKYQEEYQYFLVDEYQDTNSSQNRLLFALSSHFEQANVFAVGDPNQSIFRFQGASKENVTQFKKRFPDHSLIVLDHNYRSTPTLLNSSAELIGSTPLQPTVSYKDLPLKIAKFSSPIFEDEFILSTIQKKIKQGIPPREIAVIVKENKDIESLIPLLKQKNLPYRLQGADNILTSPYISQFLNLLTVITNIQGPVDDTDLFTVLNYPFFGLDPVSVLQVSRQAYLQRQTLTDLLLHDQPEIDDRLSHVFHQLIAWKSEIGNHSLTEMFQKVFQESGLLDHLLSLKRPLTELNRFTTLFDNAKEQAAAFPGLDLNGYIFNLQLMEDNRLKLPEKDLIGDTDSITLTTAHKAKGLEWRLVFIYRFADTHWGNKQKREMIKLPPGIIRFEDVDKEEDKNAEERRLFYVALTRSKQHVYITGSTQYDTSAKMIFPSIFLEDLPKENLKFIKIKKHEIHAEKLLTDLLTPRSLPTVHEGEEKYLQEILKDFKLSPTALNSYLDCPYRFKLDHLYRIPRAKPAPMCFGTAVHFALEHLYQDLNNGHLESKEDFLKDFEAALRREILSEMDFKSRLEHGLKVLSAYYDKYEKEFTPCLFTEKNFGTSLTSQIYLDDIALTGKADRVDLTNKEEKHVRFIDYKTGKPRSRNEIEGNTKNSTGDYKRQLTFYHLLADLDKSFHFKVVQTEIDFIEPDSSGAFHQERFNITDEEVSVLKKIIKSTMKEIRALHFPRTVDKNTCANCPFNSHCWPNGLDIKNNFSIQ